MPRISKSPEIRMTEILDCAKLLFYTRGYHKTAIRDIVKQIGVAQGTFYYYFKSKEEVLDALVKRELSRKFSELQALAEDKNMSPRCKIQEIISIMLKSVHCPEGLQFEYLYNEQYLHVLDKISRQADEALNPFLIKIVEDGIASGDFKVTHPREAVDFLMAIIKTVVFSLYKKYTEEQLKYQMKTAKRLIKEVLAAS